MALKDIGDMLEKALYRPSSKKQVQPEQTVPATDKSTIGTIKERNARNQYEIEKQTGSPVPDTFEEWYAHRQHGI